jgi:PleD family two-component response regulator
MVLFNDEKIEFFEENIEEDLGHYGQWNILIVDDEKIVHESTKMVLNDFIFENKKINFLCAYSALEAKEILSEVDDISVVLLDVVMEKDDSGLELVKFIRDELRNSFIRIILRTGQPGQAPEEEVVINYDINDYKMKTELTLQKLLTTIVSALRSYSNIMDLELNRWLHVQKFFLYSKQ